MNKQDIITGVILILIGAAIATLAFVLIQVHSPAEKSPAEKVTLCNDGWTREEVDGKIVETYLPAEDTCKKGE